MLCMYKRNIRACIIHLILCRAYTRLHPTVQPYFAIEFTKITQFAWAGKLGATSVHLLLISRKLNYAHPNCYYAHIFFELLNEYV